MKRHRYLFVWKGGKEEELYGFSPEDALNQAGYGAGALPALDYWKQLDE